MRACVTRRSRCKMNSLLKFAIDAHGGLERWNELDYLTANLSVTGAIWHVKGKPDFLKDIHIELSLHAERLITHLVGQNKRFFFTPSRLTLEDESGKLIEARNDPRSAFEGQSYETPWDDLHVAYFDSYALWTYLTIPFLYTYPGFITEELEPWREDGEIWRTLRATFPEGIASHTRVQISCFGPDGLLRRHDYTVDVLGGAAGLNYAYDYRNIEASLSHCSGRPTALLEGQLSNFNGAKSSATLRNQGSCTGIPCRGRRKDQVRTIRVSASVNAYGSFQALHCPTT